MTWSMWQRLGVIVGLAILVRLAIVNIARARHAVPVSLPPVSPVRVIGVVPSRPGRADASSRARRVRLRTALLGGLTSGAGAALAGALVSLGLRSPDAIIFNTFTVVLGSLVSGVAAGGLWWLLQRRGATQRTFGLLLLVPLGMVVAGAIAAQLLPGLALRHAITFIIPVALVVFGVLALLTPIWARPALRPVWTGPTSALLAVALGLSLVGQAQTESGRLALPAYVTSGDAAAPTTDGLLRPHDVAGAAFVVTPAAESEVTYTVREKLARLPLPNDAVGRTNQVSGVIHLDGRPSTIRLDLRTFTSDQPLREQHVNERSDGPHWDRYPYADFTVATLLDLPHTYRPGETLQREVIGSLGIREVERRVTFVIEARMDGPDVLLVLGRTDITWADFQIPPPNYSYVTVENTIHVEFLLVARQDRAQRTAKAPADALVH